MKDAPVLLLEQLHRKPQGSNMDAAVTVDARGTRCPVPINKLSRALESASATVVELLADDPNARVDVPVWCRLKHHDLVEMSEVGGAWRFVLRVT